MDEDMGGAFIRAKTVVAKYYWVVILYIIYKQCSEHTQEFKLNVRSEKTVFIASETSDGLQNA